MSSPSLTGTPQGEFGKRLGLFVATLDFRNEEVLWWTMRFEDEIGAEKPFKEIHEAFQRLRRRIAPYITAAQVQAMDVLLDAPEWNLQQDCHSLSSGYCGYHRPLGADFWSWFRLRGFDGMPDWIKERWIKDYAERGIDIVNG